VPGARWHLTLIGLLAAALLLASAAPAAPAAAQQADRPAGEDRRTALPPDDLWTSVQHDRAGAMAAPASEDGWPMPVLLLALAGAYAAGFVATYAPGLLSADDARPRDRRPDSRPPEPLPATVTQTCTIALADGAFEAFVRDARGRRRVVCRTEPFDTASDPLSQAGAAAELHRRLLDRMRAVGWEHEPVPGGAWYESRLVRTQTGRGRPPRVALVEARHAPGRVWFAAVALNGYARATPLGESPRFSPDGGDELEPDAGAAAAHAVLLADLEAAGWQVAGTLGPWYASTLRRRGATARS